MMAKQMIVNPKFSKNKERPINYRHHYLGDPQIEINWRVFVNSELPSSAPTHLISQAADWIKLVRSSEKIQPTQVAATGFFKSEILMNEHSSNSLKMFETNQINWGWLLQRRNDVSKIRAVSSQFGVHSRWI